MSLNEADTHAKLIDPAIHARGWTEELIRREETAGAIEIVNGRPRKRAQGRVDYTLRVAVNAESQPIAIALIEAKAESLPPGHGLEQAKLYCERLNVPFVFSSNGHLFVEFDFFTGKTTSPQPLAEFPRPEDLRARYEQGKGFSLDSPAAKPLLARYPGGEATRRYYQDAAIRAVLEKLARGGKRALITLATGSGKTFIAVHLLRKIADAGQLKRALFGEKFMTQWQPRERSGGGETDPGPVIQVEGIEVRVNEAGRFIVTHVNGKAMPITVEEYKERLAAKLVEEAPTRDVFRKSWIEPPRRRELLGRLPDAGRSAILVQRLEDMNDYDLYDVLAELGYGLAPRTRIGRADAFTYKHERWLTGLPVPAAATLKAMASQFARAGTDGLENPEIFKTPEVARAGGLDALKTLGRPSEILRETKKRMFAA